MQIKITSNLKSLRYQLTILGKKAETGAMEKNYFFPKQKKMTMKLMISRLENMLKIIVMNKTKKITS